MSRRRIGLRVYTTHCLALLAPGIEPYYPDIADSTQSRRISNPEDQRVLIEECRRHLDRQRKDLHLVLTRSQYLFTTGIAILALAGITLESVKTHSWVLTVSWAMAALSIVVGMWGVAANLATKNLLGSINAKRLSGWSASLQTVLADAYPEQIAAGENTLAARYIIYWRATALTFAGAFVILLIWALASITA